MRSLISLKDREEREREQDIFIHIKIMTLYTPFFFLSILLDDALKRMLLSPERLIGYMKEFTRKEGKPFEALDIFFFGRKENVEASDRLVQPLVITSSQSFFFVCGRGNDWSLNPTYVVNSKNAFFSVLKIYSS